MNAKFRSLFGSLTLLVGATHASAQIECSAQWEGVGGGLVQGPWPVVVGVTFTEFDQDGDGPDPYGLFIGGVFDAAGGALGGGVARWDGYAWQSVTGGGPFLPLVAAPVVRALIEHDADGPRGQPPSLIAGGEFGGISGVSARLVARFDGISWSAIPGLNEHAVFALASHDFDGDGPEPPRLLAGGRLRVAPSAPWQAVFVWDGSAWAPLSSSEAGSCHSLESVDFDRNPATPNELFAVIDGLIIPPATTRVSGLFRWRNGNWENANPGAIPRSTPPIQLWSLDEDGSGPAPSSLFFPTERGVARIGPDGTVPFESSSSLDVRDLSMLDPDGPGPEHGVLLATTRRYAVYWDGADWRTFGRAALWRPDEPEPAQPTRGTIHAIRAFDEDKGGPRPASVFVGGEFLKVDDAYATGVAKWSCVFEIQRCLADIDASGTVDFGDVFQILQDWSSVDRPQSDANRDGRVNFNDVSMVLGVWSAPCSARRLGDMPPEAERLADAPLVGFESLDSLAEALLRHGGDAPIGSQPD